MTCRECKNYKECNKQEKIKFELYDDGWLDEPYLCTYVESICQRFEKKENVLVVIQERQTRVQFSTIAIYTLKFHYAKSAKRPLHITWVCS